MRHRFIASSGSSACPRAGLLLLIALLLCLSTPALSDKEAAPSPEVAGLLEHILASQQNTTTLQGRFTQQKSMALFKDQERSSGHFTFRQPDSMRLDYDTPSTVVLLLEGDYLTTYYPDLGEAERFDVRKQKKRVFDHLIGESGIGQLQKNFTIELKEAGETAGAPALDSDDSTLQLHLVPRRRQLKKRIEFIDLWVRASDYAPVQYFIQEKSGDSTLFSLHDIQVNGELPEDTFRIDLPDGVVISERSSKDGDSDDQ